MAPHFLLLWLGVDPEDRGFRQSEHSTTLYFRSLHGE